MINEQQLSKDILSIKGRAKVLDKDIQSAALRAVAIAARPAQGGTGNIHFVNALYGALGKGARHVAMTEWLTQYGGMEANKGANKDSTPFVLSKDKLVDLEQGAANPWYDCAPSKKPDEVLDFLALAMAMLKKRPKEGQQVKHSEVRDQLAAIVAAVSKADEEAAELAVNDDTTTE